MIERKKEWVLEWVGERVYELVNDRIRNYVSQ